MKLAIYSTKQYDKKYLQQVNEAFGFELEFFDFLLTEKTAKTAHGCEAVCIFVNDDGSRPVLEELKKYGYHLKPQLLSSYITGYKRTPQSAVVLDLVGNILKEWEGANKNAEVH